ncbi:MAG: arsenate reductase (glutaredoxin) [Cyclobacteriaceae bacterium]
MVEIYHNSRCGKSRQTLKLLEERGEQVKIVEYLKEHPDKATIKTIVSQLGISPLDLIRKGEKIFKEQYKGKNLSDEDWIDAMVDHPILIERPIVIKEGRAALGRPPENVLEIL